MIPSIHTDMKLAMVPQLVPVYTTHYTTHYIVLYCSCSFSKHTDMGMKMAMVPQLVPVARELMAQRTKVMTGMSSAWCRLRLPRLPALLQGRPRRNTILSRQRAGRCGMDG